METVGADIGYTDIENMQNFKYNYIDISYARILFDYGIIFTIFVLFSYTILLVKCFKEKDYWLVFTLFFVLIWSIIEPYLITIGKNNFILEFIPLLEIGAINNLDYAVLKSKIKRLSKSKNEKIDS